MKRVIIPAVSALLVLLQAGCAGPIKQETLSAQISQDLSLATAGIHATSNGYFALASRSSKYGSWSSCAVATTAEEFLLYVPETIYSDTGPNDIDGGNQVATGTELVLDIQLPYREIKGVANLVSGKSHQVQLLTTLGILALELTGEGTTLLDAESARNIYETIRAHGVPEFTPRHRIGVSAGTPLLLPLPLPITVF